MAGQRQKQRSSISAVSRLLDADPFAHPRDDTELRELVRKAADRSDEPYRDLLQLLMGAHSDLNEEGARNLWLAAVAHRRVLQSQLGRHVVLRVAMLDMVAQNPELATGSRAPVVVSRSVLTDVMSKVTRDELTGLQRREQFITIVEYELAQRFRRPPIVAYLDLDGFKKVNDVYGHARGDEVLVAFGKAARRLARRGDVFARLGGDEFGALLVECDLDTARSILKRVREDFLKLAGDLGVDLSAGVALARPSESAADLIARADAAMYKEKKRKRPRRSAHGSPNDAPLAVYYGNRTEAFLELSAQLSVLGCPTLPTSRGEVLERLIRLVAPSIFVASDGPGIEEVFRQVALRCPATRLVRLLDLGAPSVNDDGEGILTLRRPVGRGASLRSLKQLTGRRKAPLPELSGPRQAKALFATVDDELSSGQGPPKTRRSIAARHEVQLLRGYLGR